MRLCTFVFEGQARIGAERDGAIVDLRAVDPALPATLRLLLAGGDAALTAAKNARDAAPSGAVRPRDAVTLLAPVPDPHKIICIGLNYRDHAAEIGMELPSYPAVFAKFANALAGDGAPIPLPRYSDKVDYEAELAFIVGTRCREVSERDALSVIAGYTCFNDVSVRDYQMRTSQWTMGKVGDGHAPCGPYLVTRDEVPDPHALRIRCIIDGETLQDSTTGELVFGIPQLVAELTKVMTLEPGDVVATGTPKGVGTSRKPQRWIRPGERVTIEIENVGRLVNLAVPA